MKRVKKGRVNAPLLASKRQVCLFGRSEGSYMRIVQQIIKKKHTMGEGM
jgi:hypothetical protein